MKSRGSKEEAQNGTQPEEGSSDELEPEMDEQEQPTESKKDK